MYNIQTAAKVSIFWLNLKEWWPFFCNNLNEYFEHYSGNPAGVTGSKTLLPIHLLQQNHLGTCSNISKELHNLRATLFTHSLKASIVCRNTESSRSNAEKALSLNLNFLQHINGMISVFFLTAQLRKSLYKSITPKINWAGNSDLEVKEACMLWNLSQTCSTLQVHS